MRKTGKPATVKRISTKPILNLESSIMMYMYQINNLSSQVSENLLRKYSISDSQYMVLIVISLLGDKATLSKIGSPLLRRPHSISAILERMEKTGLVTISGGGRGKTKKAVLTKKGAEIIKDFPIDQNLDKFFFGLTLEQRRDLLSSLKIFRSNLINNLGIRNLSIE